MRTAYQNAGLLAKIFKNKAKKATDFSKKAILNEKATNFEIFKHNFFQNFSIRKSYFCTFF